MAKEQNNCKDCGYMAYGLCLLHKKKVSVNSNTECSDLLDTSDEKALLGEIERRRSNDDAKEQSIEEKSIIQHLQWKHQLQTEQINSDTRQHSHHHKPNNSHNAKQPILHPQRTSDKTIQFSPSEVARLEKLINRRQTKQNSDPSTLKKKDTVYALSIQDEHFLDRFLDVDRERKLLLKKVSILEDKLLTTIHLAKIHLPSNKEPRSIILEKLNELLEIAKN